MKPGRKAYEDSLRQTYRRLINQLDQKTGREKQILRKYLASLDEKIRQAGERHIV